MCISTTIQQVVCQCCGQKELGPRWSGIGSAYLPTIIRIMYIYTYKYIYHIYIECRVVYTVLKTVQKLFLNNFLGNIK